MKMENCIRIKVAVLVCFICLIQVQSVPLHDKNELIHLIKGMKEISRQELIKSTVKRSADWSKRIHPSTNLEIPVHVAEESENVEVTSKAPRIVRIMRVQNGNQKGAETFKEINPESRSSEGGNRIVRIKKFRRKPARKMTTVTPETTTQITTTTPSSVDSIVTPSSPYSHITVINKEVRNPKRKKKNKKKRPNNQYVPTPPYDYETKQNGQMYVTVMPDVHQSVVSHPEIYRLNVPNAYPDYGYRNERQPPSARGRQKELPMAVQLVRNQQGLSMNQKYNGFEPALIRMPQSLNNARNIGPQSYQTNSNRKLSAPEPTFRIYDNENSPPSKVAQNRNENLKAISSEVKQNQNDSEKSKTEIPPKMDDITNTQVTVQRAGDSLSTIPPVSKERPALLKAKDEKTNTSVARNPNTEPVLYPGNANVPQNDRNIRPQQYRYPSRYPSLLFDQQNAFSDPFFDTPVISMNRPHQDMTHQLMTPFSPFYVSNDPQSERYIFGHEMHPYQSHELVLPGFHHSPHLRSLRRSILDTYSDEPTTSEPVTHFSLPKFEMPSIDFNDKGCQTVYKEVKAVPSDGTEPKNNNAKSFVMTRECYFPNGLPTTEEPKEVKTTTAPVEPKIAKRGSKDMKIDTKES